MTPNRSRTLQQRLGELLLTADPTQRLRLAQAGLAMVLMAISVGILVYAAHIGGTPTAPVLVWAAASLGGLAASYLAIRSGWSRRLADPSLTLPQMLFAIGSGAIGYAMAGALRGATFPVLLVILMFGMFQLQPRTVARVCLFTAGLFGAVMALMAWRQPQVYAPAVELGHFLMLAAMLPAVSLLAGRLTRLRERSRRQRLELAEALARIQELATRDELTGLINRRHMIELLEQERQRCVRSGHGFCIAIIDIDHFKQINDRFGHAAGDAVLQRFAREALGAIRVADVLARWGGEEFVLLLSDAHLPLARGGIERVRLRIEGLTMLAEDLALRVTISAGLTEHLAGESVVAALERADRALYEAKTGGRNRTVVVSGMDLAGA
ncbi:MAG: diguanylate cyclase [Pseudomonadota bacterium]